MQKQITKSYVEMVGLYGTALELALRTNKLLAGSVERIVQEQIELADAAVAQVHPLASVSKPEDLFEAQGAVAKQMGDQVMLTAKNVLKIQQETGEDLKALMEEGAKTFVPATVGQWLSEAA